MTPELEPIGIEAVRCVSVPLQDRRDLQIIVRWIYGDFLVEVLWSIYELLFLVCNVARLCCLSIGKTSRTATAGTITYYMVELGCAQSLSRRRRCSLPSRVRSRPDRVLSSLSETWAKVLFHRANRASVGTDPPACALATTRQVTRGCNAEVAEHVDKVRLFNWGSKKAK